MIDEDYIPRIPMIENTLVNGESEMLSLAAKRGELVTRLDTGRTYMLTAEPASILENWSELSLNEEPVVITKCSYCKGEKVFGKQCPGCGAR